MLSILKYKFLTFFICELYTVLYCNTINKCTVPGAPVFNLFTKSKRETSRNLRSIDLLPKSRTFTP